MSLGGLAHRFIRAYGHGLWGHRILGQIHNQSTWYGLHGVDIDTALTRLARNGCTVIVPFRDEMAKRYLKVAGDLGRVVFMASIHRD